MELSKKLRDELFGEILERLLVDENATKLFKEIFQRFFFKVDVPVYVLPGGKLFERQTDGAIGFDAYARAIVSTKEMDPNNPILRKTLFDFKNYPTDRTVADMVDSDDGGWMYVLEPGKSVHVGIGVLMAMPFPMVQWAAPRSGLANKNKISFENAPGTIDPDYRGEAGILLCNNGEKPFHIRKDMRIAQGLFQWAIIPNLVNVSSPEELGKTNRGVGGFGHTGLMGSNNVQKDQSF